MEVRADTDFGSKPPCQPPRIFSRKKCLPVVAALALLSLLIVLERLHTYGEPMPPDISADAVVGHELLAGKSLYTGVWNQKPPLIYMTYAALEAVAGRGYGPVAILSICVSIATMLGVFAAASVYGAWPGLWAAAFWAMVANDLTLQANEPSGEAFLNLCLAWAFAVVVREEGDGNGVRRFLAAGALFAVASLFKQNMVVIPALLMCVHVALPSAKSSRALRAGQATVAGLVGLAAWAVVFGYFGAIGHFRAFYDTVFVYNRAYANSLSGNLARSFMFSYGPARMEFALPLIALLAAGMAYGVIKGRRRPWLLLAAYAAGAHMAVALPGFFYLHYYQLYLPVLAIGAGMSVGLFAERARGGYKWAAHCAAAVSLVLLIYHEAPFYALTAREWSMKKYGPFRVKSQTLSMGLNRLLAPDETFFIWGYDPEIYFDTGRRPASALFFSLPLHAGPLRESLSRDVIRDLEKSRPELFIVNTYYLSRGYGNPVFMWLMSRYRFISSSNGFLIYARRGGGLEKRLNLGPDAANDALGR